MDTKDLIEIGGRVYVPICGGGDSGDAGSDGGADVAGGEGLGPTGDQENGGYSGGAGTGAGATGGSTEGGPSSGGTGPGQGNERGDDSTPDTNPAGAPADSRTKDDTITPVDQRTKDDLVTPYEPAPTSSTQTGWSWSGFGSGVKSGFAGGMSVAGIPGGVAGAAVGGLAGGLTNTEVERGPFEGAPAGSTTSGGQGLLEPGSEFGGDQGAITDPPAGENVPTLTPAPAPTGGEGGGGEGGGGEGGDSGGLPKPPDLPPTPDIPKPKNPPGFGEGGEATDDATDAIRRAQKFGADSTLLTGAEGSGYGDTSATGLVNGSVNGSLPTRLVPGQAGREGTRVPNTSIVIQKLDRDNQERGVDQNPAQAPTPDAETQAKPEWHETTGQPKPGQDTSGWKPTAPPDGGKKGELTFGGAARTATSTPGEALPADLTLITRYKTVPYQAVRSADGTVWLRNIVTGYMTQDIPAAPADR